MKAALTILDTNLMVLLIVGLASQDYILRHKRTQTYTVEDFLLLQDTLAGTPSVVTIPHVLAETSNLVRQFAEPGRSRICAVLQNFVFDCIETTVASGAAARRPEFRLLGLTDAALLEVQYETSVLLTDDLDLYVASVSAGRQAVNFSHLRVR
ncbi:PIN domain-containing protein [Methylobacterium sp. SyP6R]|uniref:PIN domain-containing protein n=1 Tax=Methylobacterium sp. SyP6R TaxID=2718876 RepID=UPI001F421570|nr:PIN domain-containing protein [Methylobacterium sp. SyP6R]MCF4125815.1 hypothetical protein [Methylobacterium sp. SyP6R]